MKQKFKTTQINNGDSNTESLDSLRELTLQLENLREKRVKGSIFRSKASTTNDWEKLQGIS